MKTDKTTVSISPEVERWLPLRNESLYFTSPAILAIKENTTWEEVSCVGYNPELRKLEAIVQIKQTFGYSGGLCTNGSTEYIRFFIDWGSGFENVGLSGFKAHDIPDAPTDNHPLNYMVQLVIDESLHRRLCFSPVLPKVRAVLSWNSIPTLNPNQFVQFGNKIDANIQIKPRRWFLKDFIEISKIKVSPELSALISLDQPIESNPVSLSLEELLKVNEVAKVPLHRTLHPMLSHSTVFSNTAIASKFNPAFEKLDLSKLGISWVDILKGYDKEFNTTYEELTCVGLNTETNTLGAVVHVKKQNGYSGSLCQTGSTEYVAFWADWDSNGVFDYLGTTQVKVHDITNMPADGLHYCVQLPINPQNAKRCTNPNVVKIRAVLSWQTPPSTTDPNAPVYWGNRREVRVQIKPKGLNDTSVHFHYHDIGFVQVDLINNGLAFESPVQAPGANRPFGEMVHVGGRFGTPNVHYKVEFSSNGINWFPAKTGTQYFSVFNPVTELYETQSQNSPDGWYVNPENFTGGIPIDEYNATLVDWNTNGLQGTYQLRVLYTLDPTHNTFVSTVPKTIIINNIRYNPNSAFHNYMAGGAVLSSTHTVDMIFDNGGGCISQPKGINFSGKFKAVHTYFAQANLYVLPANSKAILSSGGIVTPQSGTLVRSVDALHVSGYNNEAWTLDTTNMEKCGYVLVLDAYERTIYNNNHNLPHASISIGFAVI